MIEKSGKALVGLGTDSTLRPGDFALGSAASRAAARAHLESRNGEFLADHEVVMTGFPRSYEQPTIIPPDSVAYYEIPDGSVVEVIRREYEPGKFTAFITQVWPDGTPYMRQAETGTGHTKGPNMVFGLADLKRWGKEFEVLKPRTANESG